MVKNIGVLSMKHLLAEQSKMGGVCPSVPDKVIDTFVKLLGAKEKEATEYANKERTWHTFFRTRKWG